MLNYFGSVEVKIDPSLSEDSKLVLQAAAQLDISEFRLFELAYCHWYGRAQNRRSLEWDFEGYMFYGQVPHWVRHFSREVLREERESHLVPEHFGVHIRHATRRSIVIGIIFALIPFILLLILFMLGYSHPDREVAGECITPPCISDTNRNHE